MAAAAHLLIQFRVAGHIVAYHEEGGLDAVTVERVEHPRGHLGHRTVVERKKHHLLLVVLYAPHSLGEEEASQILLS